MFPYFVSFPVSWVTGYCLKTSVFVYSLGRPIYLPCYVTPQMVVVCFHNQSLPVCLSKSCLLAQWGKAETGTLSLQNWLLCEKGNCFLSCEQHNPPSPNLTHLYCNTFIFYPLLLTRGPRVRKGWCRCNSLWKQNAWRRKEHSYIVSDHVEKLADRRKYRISWEKQQ